MSSLVQGLQYEFTAMHFVIRKHAPHMHTPPSELALWKNVSTKPATLQLVPRDVSARGGEEVWNGRGQQLTGVLGPSTASHFSPVVLGNRWRSPNFTHRRRGSTGTIHRPMLCALQTNGTGIEAPVPWVQSRLGFQRGSSHHELLPLKRDVHVFGGSRVCLSVRCTIRYELLRHHLRRRQNLGQSF